MSPIKWAFLELLNQCAAQFYADDPNEPLFVVGETVSRVCLQGLRHPGYHRQIAAWHVKAASDLEAWARFLTRHNLDAPLTHNSHKGNW